MSHRTIRRYDKEFKLNAIKLHLGSGRNYKQIGDELGVPESTLASWVGDYKNVSRTGYYKFLQSIPSKRREEDTLLLEKIKRIHAKSRETYGSPRVHAALQLEGESCSRKRVAGLMKRSGIQAKMKKRFKVTTKVNPKVQAAPNVLNRDFTAMKPNERWVADITYSAPGTQRKQGGLNESQIYLKYPEHAQGLRAH